MGLFSFSQELAIDLGTANTIIVRDEEIVVDEPSVVAIDIPTGKLKAVGKKAAQMQERENDQVRTIRPLRDGVIADFDYCELMMREFIKMAMPNRRLFTPSIRMVIGVPTGSTEVELRAVRDAAEHAGGRDIQLIYEPMAAAIGVGIEVNKAEGSMIVDIGGGTTDIAVISLGGTTYKESIRVAGDELNRDILEYMARQHNARIGEVMAERIKKEVGAAITKLDDEPSPYVIYAPNRITGRPIEVAVTYQEIAHCIDKTISKIEYSIMNALEKLPAELYSDIVRNGIWLAGGGALIRGLDKRLSEKIREEVGIPFHVAEEPLLSVVRGVGVALEHSDEYQSCLMR